MTNRVRLVVLRPRGVRSQLLLQRQHELLVLWNVQVHRGAAMRVLWWPSFCALVRR